MSAFAASSMATQGVVTCLHDGSIVTVDLHACHMFGYENASDLLGHNVKILMPAPYREQHDQYLENYARTGVPRVIGRGRLVEAQHRDGHVFPISLNVMAAKDRNGKPVYVGALSATTSKSVHLIVSKDGTILNAVNPTELGYAAEQLLGKNVSLLVPQPWKSQHDAMMGMYYQTQVSNLVNRVRNVPLQTASGAVVQVSLRVTPSAINDVTVYHALVDLVDPALVLVLTLTRDGIIERCPVSDALVTPLLGYSPTQLPGMDVRSILPRLFSAAPPTDAPADPAAELAMDGVHKDGSTVPVLVCIALIMHDTQQRYSCTIRRRGGLSALPHSGALGGGSTTTLSGSATWASGGARPVEADALPGLSLGPVLGRGAYGLVRIATLDESRQIVAVKLMRKLELEAAALERARREAVIMRRLRHRNIVRLFNVVETSVVLALVMEYCAGGELCAYVNKKGTLGETEARLYFRQLISAVHYVHANGWIHRDIKLKNVMLVEQRPDWRENVVKLIDFGLSNFDKGEKMQSTFCGTPAYAAPEMILADSYSGGCVDIWSCGVALFVMVTGEFPFASVSNIISTSYDVSRLPSAALRDLMMRIFTRDADARITIPQIEEHAWMLDDTGSSELSSNMRVTACRVLDAAMIAPAAPSSSSSATAKAAAAAAVSVTVTPPLTIAHAVLAQAGQGSADDSASSRSCAIPMTCVEELLDDDDDDDNDMNNNIGDVTRDAGDLASADAQAGRKRARAGD